MSRKITYHDSNDYGKDDDPNHHVSKSQKAKREPGRRTLAEILGVPLSNDEKTEAGE